MDDYSIQKLNKYLILISVIPASLRLDRRTENTLVAECQVFLRQNHNDERSGIRSITYGKSKLNQVKLIEQFRKQIITVFLAPLSFQVSVCGWFQSGYGRNSFSIYRPPSPSHSGDSAKYYLK